MRRTERLFQIIQVLRARRRPVTGPDLARELNVSLRTLYRDMAELIAQRVPIRGEAGVGYVIDGDYDMPPLMLTPDELEAAVLGAAWVAGRGDAALARGARDLIAKLSTAVPPHLRPVVLDAGLTVLGPSGGEEPGFDIALARAAMRQARKLDIDYRDADGAVSRRRIWPITLAYTQNHRLLAAWCELRGDFRHFRTDRIIAANLRDEPIPTRPATLRAQWRQTLRHERPQSAMTLRAYAPGDEAAIGDVWFESWRSVGLPQPVVTRAQLQARVPDELKSRWTVTVAEQDGRILGFAAVSLGENRLDQLFIRPEAQGRGIGAALFAAARAQLASGFWLSTQPDNTQAKAFYARRGMTLDRVDGEPGHERSIYVMGD